MKLQGCQRRETRYNAVCAFGREPWPEHTPEAAEDSEMNNCPLPCLPELNDEVDGHGVWGAQGLRGN